LASFLAILILVLSFVGALREGVVKHFFQFVVQLIAILLAGLSYRLLARVLFFLPGQNWENFLGFLITLAVIGVLLHLVFLLPRKMLQIPLGNPFLFRVIGGLLAVLNSAIGLVVLTLLIRTYPIFGWLERAVTQSSVLAWLVTQLSFVQTLLPELFRITGGTPAA
jgi:uncharacterized membrane protein required for colicin V production